MTDLQQPNAIQPVGLHIRLSAEWLIDSISANSAELIDAPAAGLLNMPITALFEADTVHSIRNRIALLREERAVGYVMRCQFVRAPGCYDLTVGRSGDGYAIDAEPSPGQPFTDPTGTVMGMAAALDRCDDAAAVRELAARQLRGLTGFEQVVVDPSPSRAMMVVDRDAEAVGLLGLDDDIGRSMLRVPSAGELERLSGSGARAALILPLDGPQGSIGQIFCTHRSPRHVGLERRGVAALFAKFVALRLVDAARA